MLDTERNSTRRRAKELGKQNSSEDSSVEKKHERHYPKNGERGSMKKNLIGLARESGSYQQSLSPSQVPADFPYFNYDSVSDKHLRKEMKRLKHSKVGVRASKRANKGRESALVVRNETKGVCY